MSDYHLPELHIGKLTSKLPIIQGGMGVGISLSGLASAVADQGGIGVIASAAIGMLDNNFDKDFKASNARMLRREILAARSKTSGIIGVNIMVAHSDYEFLLLTALETGADLIFMGAGLPIKIPHILTPERLRDSKTRIVPIVSSARAADLICKSWMKSGCTPDAFVVEGPMAGGHLGFQKTQISDPAYCLDTLIEETLSAVQPHEERSGKAIPVIAAGGVYTGEDIYRLMDLGAAGVQMATRFVTTHECDAHIRFKQAYLNTREEDLVIIDSPVGLPGRAIRNDFLQEVSEGVQKPFSCPWKCLRTCDFKKVPYCIGKALTHAKLGKMEDGFVFAGANAWRANRIVSVKELMETLVAEYREAGLSEKEAA